MTLAFPKLTKACRGCGKTGGPWHGHRCVRCHNSAVYARHRERYAAAEMERRRKRGVPPRKQAMSAEERRLREREQERARRPRKAVQQRERYRSDERFRFKLRGKVASRTRAKAKFPALDLDQWEAVLVFYGRRCAYDCGRMAQHMEHVVPLSRGGHHVIGNLVPACARCNYEKGTRTWAVPRPHPWMQTAA